MSDTTGSTGGGRGLTGFERRVLRAVCDAMVPPGGAIAEGAAELGVPEQIERWIASFSPSSRRMIRAMLVGYDLTPLLSRRPRPFTRLTPAEQGRWVDASAHCANRARRETFTALQTIVQIAYASHPEVVEVIGYDGSPLVPMEEPAEPVELPMSTWPDVPASLDVDVVIVGSGAGGAVAADTLARAGFRVAVIEEGGAYRAVEEAPDRPVERMLRHYRDNGLTFAMGSPMISLPMGRAVGGTTTVNSGTCFRTPEDVLHRWERSGVTGVSPEAMAPVFDEVEEVLGVTPVPEEVLGANGSVARRGAEALGWSGGPIRRNIRGCHGHGACGFGCPIDAKQGMHVTYLPRAVASGATIVAHARVREITVEEGRAVGVTAEVRDPATGDRRGELRVRARTTVLAAGAVHTAALLMRQKLAGSSGQLGRNLVIHPGAGTSARFDEDLSAWRGTMQSWYVDEHLNDGVLLEATFPPPGLGYSAGSLPGWGRHKDLFRLYPQVASMGSICSDEGNGRVHSVGGNALVRYGLSTRDALRVLEGIARSAELFFAAGAREVFPMLPGLESISSPREVEHIRRGRWKRSEMHVSAYHPMGTARMGGDPSSSVVDPWGRTWDVPGLWVLDGSLLPSSTHVNPQITIMAMAARGAARLADTMS
ncbi:MAG: GMC family oxidoreductase N-terminal domain-containing protein [Acidimicrobiia bacterium]